MHFVAFVELLVFTGYAHNELAVSVCLSRFLQAIFSREKVAELQICICIRSGYTYSMYYHKCEDRHMYRYCTSECYAFTPTGITGIVSKT